MGDRAVTAILLIVALAIGVYLLAVLEHWASTNRLRLGAPVIAAFSLLGSESLLPRKPDRLFFETGPVLLLIAALLSLAVIPLTPDLIVTDLATAVIGITTSMA